MKLSWQGTIIGVQPRIRLTRSFNERSHTYLGYSLYLDGTANGQTGEFLVGIGKAAQAKHAFTVRDVVSGDASPVADSRIEVVDYYKAARFQIISRDPSPPATSGPPWKFEPPPLEVYRQRGHRRLSPRTFDTKCRSCVWGCRMPVEIIVDHWNPSVKRYRVETFCYGPKSCGLYRAGATRKVPGRTGVMYEEEDWVDEVLTSHRDPDE